jgi:hypothetical protein
VPFLLGQAATGQSAGPFAPGGGSTSHSSTVPSSEAVTRVCPVGSKAAALPLSDRPARSLPIGFPELASTAPLRRPRRWRAAGHQG